MVGSRPSGFSISRFHTGILVMCLFGTIVAKPDDFQFEHLTTKEGLSNNDVRAIARDSIGFLWFGTGNGLNRYDGIEIKVYQHRPNDSTSITDNDIRSLCVDRNGTLWVGTFLGGLNRYDAWTDGFKHYELDTSKIEGSRHIVALYEDRSAALWVGTDYGVYRFDRRGQTLAHYRHDPADTKSLSGDAVVAVVEDHVGDVWLSIRIKGLNRLSHNGSVITRFEHDPNNPSGIPTNWLQTVSYEDKARRLWFGSNAGLLQFERNGGSFKQYLLTPTASTDIRDNWIKGICESVDGNFFIASWGSLQKFDPRTGRFVHTLFPFDRNDNTETIRCLSYDRFENALWIGTRFGGIYRLNLNRKQFALFRNQVGNSNSLSTGSVSSILQDSKGIIWIGLFAGLDRYDPETKRFIRYRHDVNNPKSLTADLVTTLYEGRNGNILVGTSYNGFDEVDPATLEFTHHSKIPEEIPSDDIRAFHEDENGMLWLGTREDGSPGLLKYDRRKRTTINYSALIPNSPKNVLVLLPEKESALWIGDQDGLYMFDKRMQLFTGFKNSPEDSSSLSDNRVQALLQTDKGILWVGTASGLARLDRKKGTFTHYHVADGLASDDIQRISEDRHGNLWLGTGKGITRFDLMSRRFKNYDLADFSSGAYEITRSSSRHGVLFFPLGTDGFVAFHPDSIRDNNNIPPIAITDFRIGNISISPRMPNSALRQAIWLTKEITLNYTDNIITFDFAVLAYTNPAKNEYAYRMDGFDNDWTFASTRRTATYTNLDPGNYTFRVKGSNSDGVWSNKEASVKIVIMPPWWRTWWFETIGVMGLLGIIVFAYRRNITRLKKDKLMQQELSQRQIESQEAERKRLAAELHDGLGQDLLVMNNELQQFMQENEQSRGELKHIAFIVQESIEGVREISANLHPHHLERLGLCAALEAMVDKVSRSSGLAVRCMGENVDHLLPQEIAIHVYRIVQEALSNVVRHASARNVTVDVKKNERSIEITVKDDGRGFDADAELERRPSRASGNGLHGFGLSSMSERARIIGGTIQITSTADAGTTVQITVPFEAIR